MEEKGIVVSVREFVAMEDKGLIDFDLPEQRQEVWPKPLRSLLIHSFMGSYCIPEFYFVTKRDELIKYVLDGKQRFTTLLAFLRDEFKLEKNTPKVTGIEVAGLRFSQLPKLLQERILNRLLFIREISDVTAEEVGEILLRINIGVPFRNSESLRAILGEQKLKLVTELSSHNFIKSKVKMTKGMLKHYTDQELCLQMAMIYLRKDIALSGKELKKFAEDIRKNDNFMSLYAKEILPIFDYLDLAFPQKENFLRKTHVPIIFALAKEAVTRNIGALEFGQFVVGFINGCAKDSAYHLASQGNSASKNCVKVRLREMSDAYHIAFPLEQYA